MRVKMIICFSIILSLNLAFAENVDYYKILNVSPSADKQQIRASFKKLALTLHPDKNQNDPEAHGKFLLLNKAYEVLKDDELRKKYDFYGHDFVNVNTRNEYYSWSYYEENFGLFDDDAYVRTLSSVEFEHNVLSGDSIWFVYFYSKYCESCQRLTKVWKDLAKELDGVVHIAAVNCKDEWHLCKRENIKSFPSLIIYPLKKHYVGDNKVSDMVEYLLDQLAIDIMEIHGNNWSQLSTDGQEHQNIPWLLFICNTCFEENDMLKVAAMLKKIVKVGTISCENEQDLCKKFETTEGIIFWEPIEGIETGIASTVSSRTPQEIYSEVLQFLPDIKELTDITFTNIRLKLFSASTKPLLVQFYLGKLDNELELKKLRGLIEDKIHLANFNCARYAKICEDLHVNYYPYFMIFKHGDVYEVYHGKPTAHDISVFALDSYSATNLRSLTTEDFYDFVIYGGIAQGTWFVDFYVPWCPPCLRFLPELRKASRHTGLGVNFAVVDCTVHSDLCRKQNILSYPTSILFNTTDRIIFSRSQDDAGILEFIEDMMNPEVVVLSKLNFEEKIVKKPYRELWIVDYYVPWCGACVLLTGEWRKLAKMVSDIPNVHIGEVDCSREVELCNEQGVQSYPSIWLYPYASTSRLKIAIFSGQVRTAENIYLWLFHFMPQIVDELNDASFPKQVLYSTDLWIINFYAPWCGHCHSFAPEFYRVAQKLQGKVRAGKLNCDAYADVCRGVKIKAYPTVRFYLGVDKSRQGHDIRSQSMDKILEHIERIMDSSVTLMTHDEL